MDLSSYLRYSQAFRFPPWVEREMYIAHFLFSFLALSKHIRTRVDKIGTHVNCFYHHKSRVRVDVAEIRKYS